MSDIDDFDISALTTAAEVRHHLHLLSLREEKLNANLNSLLAKKPELESRMNSLYKLIPRLQLAQSDAEQLQKTIEFTSTLAENVSSKIHVLDGAKSRVSECMGRVKDILDVKFCTDGVQAALQNEDYEKAAAHIHRFLSLDENLIRLTAQDLGEDSSLASSFSLLREAQTCLHDIVLRRFDEAVRDGDLASIERFFKIFPLLNQHDEGLRKFCVYLCSQVAQASQQNLATAKKTEPTDKRYNVIYADTVTLLFEGIARIIETQQPIFETYYGPGRLYTVILTLQKECDIQARKIIDEFKHSRDYQGKLNRVKSMNKMSTSSNLARMDPRDLDAILGEMTVINSRAELYLRFTKRRILNDLEVAIQDENLLEEKHQDVKQFIKNCELSRLMQELLGCYILMEEYFLRESVNKAVAMDTTESGQLTSSMVDDTFYIVKKCIRRALNSSSVDGVCAMINNACTVLQSDFTSTLQNPLRQGFPSGMLDLTQAYNVIQSSLQQGKLHGSDIDKTRATFLVTLNNAEAACDFTQTLRRFVESEADRQLSSGITEQEKAKLESCLSDLGGMSGRFRGLLDYGMQQLASSCIKPRVKPWVDAFQSVSHEINEDDFSHYEANDPFIQQLVVNLDGLLTSFKDTLSTNNYELFVGQVTSEVTVQLEKSVLKSSFNRLGGLQFDKEVRALVVYLTSITSWTIRDKFARLTQIATILNLETVGEILDYWGPNSGSLTWRLTPTEVRAVLALRVDFRHEDIKRLKL